MKKPKTKPKIFRRCGFWRYRRGLMSRRALLLCLDLRTRRLVEGRVAGQCLVALDQPPGNIIGDRLDHRFKPFTLGERHTGKARVLQKTIGAPVTAHFDEGDHIDEEARPFARHQRDIEQIDIFRHFGEDRQQFIPQHFEPRDLGAAQFGNDTAAFGVIDTRQTHGAPKPLG